jgi:phosphoribosyl-ATP pyrophosphohydrolase/phosphoribosyl-AMP cyclohydrolase
MQDPRTELKLDWEKNDGLIPAIIQDDRTERVLMHGMMSAESLDRTVETGKVTFYSRSKERLWTKGESSGNHLMFRQLHVDCDGDALLVRADPLGPVCHQGWESCFGDPASSKGFVRELEGIVHQRRAEGGSDSYTARLFGKGRDKIAQKLGEEATETVIAAKNEDDAEFLNESADLLYHYLVLLAEKGKRLVDVEKVLQERHREKGDPKKEKRVDRS